MRPVARLGRRNERQKEIANEVWRRIFLPKRVMWKTPTMVISSRTPEGRSNRCPVCGSDIKIEPSDPPGDAPCPVCGHLIWFTWYDLGVDHVITLQGNRVVPESVDALIDFAVVPPGMRFILDFSEVEYVSSAAHGKLLNLKRKVGAVRGELLLRHVRPDVLEVLRLTRLDNFFKIEA